jgi:hypothetical protein
MGVSRREAFDGLRPLTTPVANVRRAPVRSAIENGRHRRAEWKAAGFMSCLSSAAADSVG